MPFRWTTEKIAALGLLKSQDRKDAEIAKILGCTVDQAKKKIEDIKKRAEIRLQERAEREKNLLATNDAKSSNKRSPAALIVFGEGKKLADLANHGECRFPVGGIYDKTHIFCAAKSVDRGYCAEHAKICFTPVRPITSLPR